MNSCKIPATLLLMAKKNVAIFFIIAYLGITGYLGTLFAPGNTAEQILVGILSPLVAAIGGSILIGILSGLRQLPGKVLRHVEIEFRYTNGTNTFTRVCKFIAASIWSTRYPIGVISVLAGLFIFGYTAPINGDISHTETGMMVTLVGIMFLGFITLLAVVLIGIVKYLIKEYKDACDEVNQVIK